ncbi:Synaptic vesicle membrane protein VAT-1-like [Galemys pyrenaicus]|uniref:Synaptic vesicle membrane protein VAT-1-like n=1 Tax=Galemys pyrenaicus TaxID=202257 RepID=A0A8J6ACU4_GALPY|nr:Synaptic vesicle membrane protein VAT-1-like [Galemys pyrenaicus]
MRNEASWSCCDICEYVVGLNFIDLMVRQGNIDNPPKTPLVPGFECSGIVEALGDSVKGYEIGDRVMAFVNYNAWAEVVCTPMEFVYKIPDDMSFSEAAAFPMNFVTAYMMLFEVANLREGMSVLVHSAGGGVASATLPAVAVGQWRDKLLLPVLSHTCLGHLQTVPGGREYPACERADGKCHPATGLVLGNPSV